MEETEEEEEDVVVNFWTRCKNTKRKCIHNKGGAEQKPSKVANYTVHV